MDIQTRKLEFIQEFLKIQSEEIISRLERILKNIDDDFSPLTIEEFNSRIDQSLEDSKNDKVIESNKLMAEIKQWQKKYIGPTLQRNN